ncbi:hypothetical protein MARPU_08710 [Marichromatium purpuratum 984]|uniref:Glyoxalase-like domain-containing protein n=1 Tax=Marichromatium purpuratum 984 TaxID=765910 RepID=W0DZ87_MARPU|nr:VOC family protein [Marichromatium purpuratum]AHF03935.1 hypothetical protein MARPU_08710 [Marichromatium purpuratum 984]
MHWPLDRLAGRGAGRRMIGWRASGEGFCDLAMVSGSLAATREALCAADVPIARVVRWQWRRADGEKVRFSFACPHDPALPFLVSPFEPCQRHPTVVEHANGARSLSRIWLEAPAARHAELRRLIGDDPTIVLGAAPDHGVRAIALVGLGAPLDPGLLHGAEIRMAPR